ncbi:MAG TPA: hypothetical protein VFM18_18080 [Methanosarcina sp.]|nr:hypothetical protein [Methanosarcina sp.]
MVQKEFVEKKIKELSKLERKWWNNHGNSTFDLQIGTVNVQMVAE